MKKEKIPLRIAFASILLSVLCVGGIAEVVIQRYQQWKVHQRQNAKFTIKAIAQTCPDPECLKTVYLAELLDLAIDKPTNFYAFDVEEAQKKLKGNPLIKSATVKKIPPQTIYVDYVLRRPVAFLGDYTNTAMDSEGYLFPFKPFFTPKILPEIFVGLTSFSETSKDAKENEGKWGNSLQGERAQLALSVYRRIASLFEEGLTRLKKIDTSKAFDPSYGRREVIVVLEDQLLKQFQGRSILYICPKILRLNTQEIDRGLTIYKALSKNNFSSHPSLNKHINNNSLQSTERQQDLPPMIIDLRIPSLALVKVHLHSN